MTDTQLVGASVWEEELYNLLSTHEQNEREMLVEYQAAANATQSPAFQYLAGLIVEDEIRHHRVWRELAASLRTDAEMRPEEPAIPRLGQWGSDPGHIVELARKLADHEREDLKQLRRVAKEMKDVRDTTLWGLLVELMEMDTAKHIAILEFVRRHAGKL